MMFLHRICMICLFILLTTYNADSYKWQPKELEDNISFLLNYTPLKRLVEPLSYIIIVDTVWEENNIFKSNIEILFIIEYPTMQINLSAHTLSTREIDVIHFDRYPYLDSYNITKLSSLNEKETLILDFKTEIPSGYYHMQILYTGNIFENEVGFYRTTCKKCTGSLKILVAQLKPTAARRVFPCWDEPVFKSRFSIGILHDRNYTSLSNMPIRKQQTIGVITLTQFNTTPPIPTYLVAFVLMDFDCSIKKDLYSITRVCSTSLVQEQITFVQKITHDVIIYMKMYTRMSPRLREITHIGLPDFSYEAAGNWGINIYRENHLIYNGTLHPIEHKLDVWMYVSSMVSLQWVGNLVSPTSWTHMWFSQTLALFYAVKAFNEIYDDKDITSLFTYRLQSLARENNVVSQVKPVMYPTNNSDEIDRLFRSSHFTNYLKEYAIIVMLENAVTKSIFQGATIDYLKKYQFSTATPNDFWHILQDMIKENLPTDLSIAQVVQSWLEHRSLPVITVVRYVMRYYTNHYVKIVIRPQYKITKDGDTENIDKLWIPINYINKSSPDVPNFKWLSPQNESFTLDLISDLEWVIGNWQCTGYYRVKYDTRSLEILATYLKSEERTKIHVLNRAHIIEDAYYFWWEGKLNIQRFLHLIRFMSKEEQCAPWYAMQNIMQKMWPFLNIDIGTRAESVIVDVLAKLLLKVGYTEHPNDTECVKFKRLLATKWACRLLHRPCLEFARLKLLAHLNVPELKTILPMWEEWTYCNGLLSSEYWIHDMVFQLYNTTGNQRILKYLVCSKNISLIHEYLEIAMSNNSIISHMVNSEDRQNIYRSIIRKHISKNGVFHYVLEKMMQMEIDDEFFENISFVIENVYSRSQLAEILVFLYEDLNVSHPFYKKLKSKVDNQLSQIAKWKALVNGI